MGSAEGGPIPIKIDTAPITSYQKDKEGNTIITTLNEQMLKQIAQSGGGSYIRANSTQSGLNALFKEINKMEKKKLDPKYLLTIKIDFNGLLV